MRVDEDGTLEKYTDVTDLLVDELNISMEATGVDASWLNGNNERHNIIIHNIVIAALIYSNHHSNKWYFASETSSEVYICKIHSVLDKVTPNFPWCGKRPSINEIRSFGCDIYPITPKPNKLNYRTQEVSFTVNTNRI